MENNTIIIKVINNNCSVCLPACPLTCPLFFFFFSLFFGWGEGAGSKTFSSVPLPKWVCVVCIKNKLLSKYMHLKNMYAVTSGFCLCGRCPVLGLLSTWCERLVLFSVSSDLQSLVASFCLAGARHGDAQECQHGDGHEHGVRVWRGHGHEQLAEHQQLAGRRRHRTHTQGRPLRRPRSVPPLYLRMLQGCQSSDLLKPIRTFRSVQHVVLVSVTAGSAECTCKCDSKFSTF